MPKASVVQELVAAWKLLATIRSPVSLAMMSKPSFPLLYISVTELERSHAELRGALLVAGREIR